VLPGATEQSRARDLRIEFLVLLLTARQISLDRFETGLVRGFHGFGYAFEFYLHLRDLLICQGEIREGVE
jgi:hypothetical protein